MVARSRQDYATPSRPTGLCVVEAIRRSLACSPMPGKPSCSKPGSTAAPTIMRPPSPPSPNAPAIGTKPRMTRPPGHASHRTRRASNTNVSNTNSSMTTAPTPTKPSAPSRNASKPPSRKPEPPASIYTVGRTPVRHPTPGHGPKTLDRAPPSLLPSSRPAYPNRPRPGQAQHSRQGRSSQETKPNADHGRPAPGSPKLAA